jgi:hypothetical protein
MKRRSVEGLFQHPRLIVPVAARRPSAWCRVMISWMRGNHVSWRGKSPKRQTLAFADFSSRRLFLAFMQIELVSQVPFRLYPVSRKGGRGKELVLALGTGSHSRNVAIVPHDEETTLRVGYCTSIFGWNWGNADLRVELFRNCGVLRSAGKSKAQVAGSALQKTALSGQQDTKMMRRGSRTAG